MPMDIFNFSSNFSCNDLEASLNFPKIIPLSKVAILFILKTESLLSPVNINSLSFLVSKKSVFSNSKGRTEDINATQTSFLLYKKYEILFMLEKILFFHCPQK